MNYQNLTVYLLNNSLWMSWNLFLALIPFLLATHLFHPKRKVSLLWSIGLVFFVLFLPNAPYILTDLIHLYTTAQNVSSPFFLAAATGQFLIFQLIGFFLFAEGYHRFEKFILKKKWYSQRYVIRMMAFLTMSVGVYLGRVLRFNSWDVFFQPMTLVRSLEQLFALDAFLYIGMFTFFLLMLYKIHEVLTVRS